MLSSSDSRFLFKVEGITCVKCAGRIEEALRTYNPPAFNIRIDILTNNVLFSISNRTILDEYKNLLSGIGYTVKNVIDVTTTREKNARVLRFKVE